MRASYAALVLAVATGCAPVARLSDERVFDQALCAAKGHAREPEAALAYVRDRIDEQARPRLHLYPVPAAELRRSMGEAGARLAERAVVVRAIAAIDDVRVDDFQLRVLLVGREGAVFAMAPHVEQLTELTGESMPATETEVIESRRRVQWGRVRDRPLLGAAALMLEASTMFIVPVTELTGHTRQVSGGVVVTEPTEAEIVASAPAASALATEAARRTYVRYADGREVSSVWLWPRPPDEPLRLVIEWSYSAYGCAGSRPTMRRGHDGASTAEVVRVVERPLPPGPDLESRLAAVFGDRMQLLVR